MVEIIVTFALTGLFMSSAALVLSTFTRIHVHADMVAKEQSVATILLGTVTGELGAARYKGDDCFATLPDGTPSDLSGGTGGAGNEKQDCQLLILNTDSNSSVWYVNGENDTKVNLCLKEGYLVWTYYPEAAPGEPTPPDPVVWKLGENVYDGFKVKKFTVNRLKASTVPGATPTVKTNCLEATVVLENSLLSGHSYTMSRSFECYKLEDKHIVDKGETTP